MKCGLRKFVACVLILTTGLGLAVAQEAPEQDDVLMRYSLAMENLAVSVAALPNDSAAANDEIERALNAMLTLSENTTSSALIGAMERVFERARLAIQNQSTTDLEVQTAVLAGGFQRLVYESALQAAAEGQFEISLARLERIIADLGLDPTVPAALAEEADSASSLRFVMESAIAERIQSLLLATRAQLATSRDQAYQTMATAYGTLLLVQDSPRADASINDDFVAAIGALVGGDLETLDGAIGRLDGSLAKLAGNARSSLAGLPEIPVATEVAGTPTTPPPALAEGATPAVVDPDAVNATANLDPSAAADTTSTTSTTTPTSTSTTSSSTSTAASTDASTAGSTPLSGLAASATDVASAVAVEREADRQALEQELVGFPISAPVRAALASRLLDNGYVSMQDVLDSLYTISAQAVVAVENGDQETAKRHIAAFAGIYADYLSPIVTARDTTFDQRTRQLTTQLHDALALRLQDVVILAGQVDALEAVLNNVAPSGTHNATVSTALFWTGLVRLVVIIVFGLLAFVPLYLLNLAFGGGNRNWQLVGVALFLLLLPIIYESFAFIGSLVASLTGIRGFEILASYSIFQNTISQVVWTLVTATAVGFSIAGLYGICVQFGLLGRRPAAMTRGVGDTIGSTTELQADTAVDWDEEF